MRLTATAGLFALVAFACDSGDGTPVAGLQCGEGTHEEAGFCLSNVKKETVVQTGELKAPAEGAKPSGWETVHSLKLGVQENATFDDADKGDPAFDAATHPLVFITTVGPGYAGKVSDVKLPGVAVIDADTHDVLAYQAYDVLGMGWEDVFEPHGLGVSEDGQWIYLPTGDGRDKGRLLIINAKTLKLHKILATRGRPHHGKSFLDAKGNARSLVYGWEQPPFIMDPKDDNRIVGGPDFNDTGMEGYLWFVTPDGKELWGSGRWRKGNIMSEIHGNQVMVVDTETWALKEAIAFEGESTPVWIEFTPDNKLAYVSGGHSSTVAKIKRGTEEEPSEVLAIARCGVEGPYGIRLNWDGTELYSVGKGEGSHNKGKDMGLLKTADMEVKTQASDQFITDCLRGDHATTHPDPAKNELWLSCNASFEVAIFNMETKEVTSRIPMPEGGSTHSGSFVKYDASFKGQVLSDQNGLHGSARDEQLKRMK